MYVMTPPTSASAKRSSGSPVELRFQVTDVRSVTFGSPVRPLDRASREYLTAMLVETGVTIDQGALDRPGNSYAEMTKKILRMASAQGELGIELLVIASAVPDYFVADLATVRGHEEFPSIRAAYGINEAGSGAPYVAVRTAATFAERLGIDKVAIVLLDQATLPYEFAGSPAQRPTRDTAVLIVMERVSIPGILLSHKTSVFSRLDQAEAITSMITELSELAGCDPKRVIAGADVSTEWLGSRRPSTNLSAPFGGPCTAAWRLLGEGPVEVPIAVIDSDLAASSVRGVLLLPPGRP